MQASETPELAGNASLKSPLIAALAGFGLALSALLLLAWRLGVAPGSAFATHLSILFEADSADRWEEITAAVSPRFSILHPLLGQFWGRIGAALAWLLSGSRTPEAARFLAAVGLVCSVAAVGYGALAATAARLNPRRWNVAILFPVCLLFTANTIVAQPDHFGLSFGLFGVASLALLPGLKGWNRTRGALVVVTGVLAAGTTVTGGLYPALVAVIAFRDHLTPANLRRFRHVILAAAAVAAVTVAAVGVLVAVRGARGQSETRAMKFLTLRLVRDPAASIRYAGSGLLYPAVGPVPTVSRMPDDPVQQPYLSYEASRLSDYGPLSGAAACAWAALLAASSFVLVRSPDLRNYGFALFGWIAFNFALHNLWGDEFFLFSPHWSWALSLIALLGSRALPTWAVALAAALIVPGQLSTLNTIRELLAS